MRGSLYAADAGFVLTGADHHPFRTWMQWWRIGREWRETGDARLASLRHTAMRSNC
jgi:hypothetical protein